MSHKDVYFLAMIILIAPELSSQWRSALAFFYMFGMFYFMIKGA